MSSEWLVCSSSKLSKLRSFADAVGEINSETTHALNDRENVDITAADNCSCSNSESNNVHGNILDLVSACISSVCAKSAAVILASGAVLPADGAVSGVARLARRVAESTTHLEARLASERNTSTTAIGTLSTWNTNVSHSRWAVWWANATSNIVEVSSASGIPDGSPLLTTKLWVVSVTSSLIPDGIANTTAISWWLVAESTVITELAGAVLPADGADTVEARSAKRIAESSIFLLTISAGCDNLPDSSAISILPARGGRDSWS
jgi:hypothetical protein